MLSLQGMLGVKSYKTVWTMSHKIRKAMADREAQYQLTGVLETLRAFLKPPDNSTRADDGESRSRIVITVEDRGEGPGLARMRHFSGIVSDDEIVGGSGPSAGAPAGDDERKAKSETDLRNCYDQFSPLLIHDRKPRRMKWARILMANLTGNIRGVHHGVSEKHLHRYIAEFSYRFNRRAVSSQLLNRALLACVSASTITYAELKI